LVLSDCTASYQRTQSSSQSSLWEPQNQTFH
jgi:hypothetical protein